VGPDPCHRPRIGDATFQLLLLHGASMSEASLHEITAKHTTGAPKNDGAARFDRFRDPPER
jgi:hypothetical protein